MAHANTVLVNKFHFLYLYDDDECFKPCNQMCLSVRAHSKCEYFFIYFFKIKKYEKPKFVQCLAFLNNGDILTGDSGGVLLIWTRSTADPPPGKGLKGIAFSLFVSL